MRERGRLPPDVAAWVDDRSRERRARWMMWLIGASVFGLLIVVPIGSAMWHDITTHHPKAPATQTTCDFLLHSTDPQVVEEGNTCLEYDSGN